MQVEGYTRDISSTSVYVLTGERLPSGTAVKLEIALPSLRGRRRSGACLRTQGHVVRSEEVGFAAVADMGFRMQLPRFSDEILVRGNGGSKHEADGKETKDKFVYFVSRPYSA
jgi:hypothetical protein